MNDQGRVLVSSGAKQKSPPGERQEPLPWQCAAIPEHDPEAAERPRDVTARASYRQADGAPDFRNHHGMHGMRLRVDCDKGV
ncbi:MAG: hypothetical protein LJE59_07880 [Chromatiaceae bacterium]|jgi:hypothetical protein|nr:hypothetical protein [Chromatiaceae bacterium]